VRIGQSALPILGGTYVHSRCACRQQHPEGAGLAAGLDPNILGFLIILLVGYLIARVVRTVVAKLLEKVGVDKAPHESSAGQYVERVSPGAHPSRLIGAVAFWFISIYAIAAAIGALKIPSLTNVMANVQNHLPNVIVAVLIFVVGAALAGAVGGFAQKLMGDTPTGRVARAVGPGLILAIVVFMVLTQLKIALAIVTATYVALIGILALAGALAFGSAVATSRTTCSATRTAPRGTTSIRASRTCSPAVTVLSNELSKPSRPSSPTAPGPLAPAPASN
jgi:hypothetical protein